MICQFKISEFGNLGLEFLNRGILEFLHFATVHTDQMVMVVSAIQFKDGISSFEVMSHDQTSGLKLCKDPIDRSKTDFFTFTDQRLKDILGTQVLSIVGSFQDFEDLDAGQGDFKACVPDIFAFQGELLPGVKVAFIGYDERLIKANSSYHAAISLCWSGRPGGDSAYRLQLQLDSVHLPTGHSSG
ncbi:MAG: hypothetical protein RLZ25_1898 [Pseudomonadota bacterium]|jgi:hypothetical protein